MAEALDATPVRDTSETYTLGYGRNVVRALRERTLATCACPICSLAWHDGEC